jgi:NADPH-dependent 2,4-dienoyl-CoA reductase/sulfur reductase-like enzyme
MAITLFQEEACVSYSGCGQPYVLSGAIPERDALIIRRPGDFARDGIEVRVRHRVSAIDLDARRVRVQDLDRGWCGDVAYDRLILATGARPIVPTLPGTDLAGVVTLRGMAALDHLLNLLESTRLHRAVVVGGGYVGVEVVEALATRGLEVALLERDIRFPPRIDPEIGELVHHHLSGKGIAVFSGETLERIDGDAGHVGSVFTSHGRPLPTQLVVLALGVRPVVELAANSGIRLGPTGAIAVDERMATSATNVYAAGDCAETRHRITQKPTWLPLGDIANLQGRVAGENAAGGDVRFPGVLGTCIFKCFELAVGTTGLGEDEARGAGFDPITAVIEAQDTARYYPGAKPLTLKLIAEARSGRLLGCQAAGIGRVDKLIDITATALLGNLTCDDLQNADLAYAPPFSPVLSPIIVAAGVLAKKQRDRA